MSQDDKPGQPPDLIDVFKALTSAFKQLKKGQTERPGQRTPQPTGRERDAPARAAPSSFSHRDADFDQADDDDFYEDLYEKTSSVALDRLAARPPTPAAQDAAGARPPPAHGRQSALPRATVTRLGALRQKLRQPETLREAIVINELLQKPVALRRRAR